MRSPLALELQRKSFHMLSLIYLAAYWWWGWPAVLRPMAAWAVIVVCVETWRLSSTPLNRALTDFFGGLAREDENDKYSGIFHTTLGVLVVMLACGGRPDIVAAAVYCAAFGDAAAALAGKSFGRHKIGGGKKSWEGTAACFAVCALVVGLMRFPLYSTILAAGAASLVEFLPTTRWRNDNFWMPIVTGGVLRLCAGF